MGVLRQLKGTLNATRRRKQAGNGDGTPGGSQSSKPSRVWLDELSQKSQPNRDKKRNKPFFASMARSIIPPKCKISPILARNSTQAHRSSILSISRTRTQAEPFVNVGQDTLGLSVSGGCEIHKSYNGSLLFDCCTSPSRKDRTSELLLDAVAMSDKIYRLMIHHGTQRCFSEAVVFMKIAQEYGECQQGCSIHEGFRKFTKIVEEFITPASRNELNLSSRQRTFLLHYTCPACYTKLDTLQRATIFQTALYECSRLFWQNCDENFRMKLQRLITEELGVDRINSPSFPAKLRVSSISTSQSLHHQSWEYPVSFILPFPAGNTCIDPDDATSTWSH